MKLEYVASGLAHTRLTNKDLSEDAESIAFVNRCLQAIQDKHNHYISFLFNGYTEERLGECMNSLVGSSLYNIYADSGGLQMVTRGHKSTKELKDAVYKVQAKLSTVALSFDEIPLVLTEGRSNFHDTKSRYFDKSQLEAKARLSGKNLREQVEYFRSVKSKSKPLLIMQGNSIDTYQQWLDVMADELGDCINDVELASGAAPLGQGFLEDSKRFFALTQLKYPKEFKHYHILGIGSPQRLLPLIALARVGHFKGKLVSYDSTTHTRGLNCGYYFMDGRLVSLGRSRGRKHTMVYNHICGVLEKLGLPPIDEKQMFNQVCMNDKLVREPFTTFERYSTLYSFLTAQIYNFIEMLDLMFTDDKLYASFANRDGYFQPMELLARCRDQQDFDDWVVEVRSSIESKAVPEKSEDASIEGFFS